MSRGEFFGLLVANAFASALIAVEYSAAAGVFVALSLWYSLVSYALMRDK